MDKITENLRQMLVGQEILKEYDIPQGDIVNFMAMNVHLFITKENIDNIYKSLINKPLDLLYFISTIFYSAVLYASYNDKEKLGEVLLKYDNNYLVNLFINDHSFGKAMLSYALKYIIFKDCISYDCFNRIKKQNKIEALIKFDNVLFLEQLTLNKSMLKNILKILFNIIKDVKFSEREAIVKLAGYLFHNDNLDIYFGNGYIIDRFKDELLKLAVKETKSFLQEKNTDFIGKDIEEIIAMIIATNIEIEMLEEYFQVTNNDSLQNSTILQYEYIPNKEEINQ